MFKNKWKKRYEQVYDIAVFWRDYYRKARDEAAKDNSSTGVRFQEIYSAQAIAMDDLIHDIERIMKN